MNQEKTNVEQQEETKFERKVKESFIEPDENLIAILGANTAKTFFSTGVLGNGFAILSDKRMYFKGRCYVRAGKGFFKKMEERVVDLNDITGTGFVHNKNMITTVLYRIFAVLGMATFGLPTVFWIVYLYTHKKWAHTAALIAFPFTGLFYLIDRAFNYSLFEVSYAGGGIAFDLSWITKADSDSFQKSLQSAKAKYKKKSQHNPFSDYIPPAPNPDRESVQQLSIPQQLKEYKELLDSGVITLEEFEIKKKQLLEL